MIIVIIAGLREGGTDSNTAAAANCDTQTSANSSA